MYADTVYIRIANLPKFNSKYSKFYFLKVSTILFKIIEKIGKQCNKYSMLLITEGFCKRICAY